MPSPHGLAGVDDLFKKCIEFCLTTLTLHAVSQRIHGGERYVRECPLHTDARIAPGLLITGRSGAGKTALLHAVCKALHGDTRTLSCPCYPSIYIIRSRSSR